jgi:uncharacterized protein YcbX
MVPGIGAKGCSGDNAGMRIESIYVSPVKSLGMTRLERAEVTTRGIAGDRAFVIADERGRVVTQRECPPMVRARAEYDVANERLRLILPDATIEDAVRTTEDVETRFYDNPIAGAYTDGAFDAALSSFMGVAVRLVKVRADAHGFDAFPISICSLASLERVREAATVDAMDERRFRQNIYISGAAAPHEEDTWIGRDVRAGAVTLRPMMQDLRCRITTQNPDTGERDLDTLNIIAGYRKGEPKQVNFGVYCNVVTSGVIAVGDDVRPEVVAETAR